MPCWCTPCCLLMQAANVMLKSTTSDARGFVCKLGDFGLSRWIPSVYACPSEKASNGVSLCSSYCLPSSKTPAVQTEALGFSWRRVWRPFHLEPPARVPC